MISRVARRAREDRLVHRRHRGVPGGRASSIQPKNFSALKPGVQKMPPPAASGASMPAIRPWMWNSGMMLRPRSAAVSASVSAMLPADDADVALRQRHDLGSRRGARRVQDERDVAGLRVARAVAAAERSGRERKAPARRRRGPDGARGSRTSSFAATAMAAEALARARRPAPWRRGRTCRTRILPPCRRD